MFERVLRLILALSLLRLEGFVLWASPPASPDTAPSRQTLLRLQYGQGSSAVSVSSPTLHLDSAQATEKLAELSRQLDNHERELALIFTRPGPDLAERRRNLSHALFGFEDTIQKSGLPDSDRQRLTAKLKVLQNIILHTFESCKGAEAREFSIPESLGWSLDCLSSVTQKLVEWEPQTWAENGPFAPWLPFIALRYEELKHQGDALEVAARQALAPKLERLRLILEAVRSIQRVSNGDKTSVPMMRLLNRVIKSSAASSNASDNAGLRNLHAQLNRIQEAAQRRDQSSAMLLAQAFDGANGLRRQLGQDAETLELVAGVQQELSKKIAPTTYPKPVRRGPVAGPVPHPAIAVGGLAFSAANIPQAPAAGSLRFSLVQAASRLVPNVREIEFSRQRSEKRTTMLLYATAAIRSDLGAQAEAERRFGKRLSELTLEEADEFFLRELPRKLRNPWPTYNPSNAQEAQRMQQEINAVAEELAAMAEQGRALPFLTEYLNLRLQYQASLAQAVQNNPGMGVKLRPWELGLPATLPVQIYPETEPRTRKVLSVASRVIEEEIDGAQVSFRGFLYELEGGIAHFQGTAGAGNEARLLVVNLGPGGNVEQRVHFRMGTGGAPEPTFSILLEKKVDAATRQTRIVRTVEDLVRSPDFTWIEEFDLEGRALQVTRIDKTSKTAVTVDHVNKVQMLRQGEEVTITPLEGPQWLQYGLITAAGFVPKEMRHPDGRVLYPMAGHGDFPKPHVLKIYDSANAFQGYQVKLEDLEKLTGQRRYEEAGLLAREIIAVLALDQERFREDEGGKYTVPLRNFLYDLRGFPKWLLKDVYGKSDAEMNRLAGRYKVDRLSVDANGRFTLILTDPYGNKDVIQLRYENGKGFVPTSPDRHAGNRQGRRYEHALVVHRPIKMDGELKKPIGQPQPFRWVAYLQGGQLMEWELPHTWKNQRRVYSDEEVTEIWVKHWVWEGQRERGEGVWWVRERPDQGRYARTKIFESRRDLPNTNMGAQVGKFVDDIPGVGWLLGKTSSAASAIWNYTSGKAFDLVDLKAVGAARRKQAIESFNKCIGTQIDTRMVSGLDRETRKIVEGTAQQQRQDEMRRLGIYELYSEEAIIGMHRADFTPEDLEKSLSHWADPAKILFEEAKYLSGSDRAKNYFLGGLLTGVDVAGTILSDPLTWATLGAGAAVNGMKGAIQAGRGWAFLAAPKVPMALNIARGVQVTLTVPFVLPLAAGALEHGIGGIEALQKGDTGGAIKNFVQAGVSGFFLLKMGKEGVKSAKDLYNYLRSNATPALPPGAGAPDSGRVANSNVSPRSPPAPPVVPPPQPAGGGGGTVSSGPGTSSSPPRTSRGSVPDNSGGTNGPGLPNYNIPTTVDPILARMQAPTNPVQTARGAAPELTGRVGPETRFFQGDANAGSGMPAPEITSPRPAAVAEGRPVGEMGQTEAALPKDKSTRAQQDSRAGPELQETGAAEHSGAGDSAAQKPAARNRDRMRRNLDEVELERMQRTHADAVEAAHRVGRGDIGKDGGPAGVGNYTPAQLKQKAAILREAGFQPDQVRALVERGRVGDPPGSNRGTPGESPETRVGPDQTARVDASDNSTARPPDTHASNPAQPPSGGNSTAANAGGAPPSSQPPRSGSGGNGSGGGQPPVQPSGAAGAPAPGPGPGASTAVASPKPFWATRAVKWAGAKIGSLLWNWLGLKYPTWLVDSLSWKVGLRGVVLWPLGKTHKWHLADNAARYQMKQRRIERVLEGELDGSGNPISGKEGLRGKAAKLEADIAALEAQARSGQSPGGRLESLRQQLRAIREKIAKTEKRLEKARERSERAAQKARDKGVQNDRIEKRLDALQERYKNRWRWLRQAAAGAGLYALFNIGKIKRLLEDWLYGPEEGTLVPPGSEKNEPPKVSASADQTTLKLKDSDPEVATMLRGSVKDDGLPNPPGRVDVSWIIKEAPNQNENAVALKNRRSLTTQATFKALGKYVVALTAYDGAAGSPGLFNKEPAHVTITVVRDSASGDQSRGRRGQGPPQGGAPPGQPQKPADKGGGGPAGGGDKKGGGEDKKKGGDKDGDSEGGGGGGGGKGGGGKKGGPPGGGGGPNPSEPRLTDLPQGRPVGGPSIGQGPGASGRPTSSQGAEPQSPGSASPTSQGGDGPRSGPARPVPGGGRGDSQKPSTSKPAPSSPPATSSSDGAAPPSLWPFNPRNPFTDKKAPKQQKSPAKSRPQVADSRDAPIPASSAGQPRDNLDLMRTYLRPAKHMNNNALADKQEAESRSDKLYLLRLLLTIAGLLAAVFLFQATNLPFVLGLRRNKKND